MQVGSLVLRCGEYLLDLLDIHVPKDTLDLFLVLMQVYGSPHAGIQTYSPNRFVDQEIVLHVFKNLEFCNGILTTFLPECEILSRIQNRVECKISCSVTASPVWRIGPPRAHWFVPFLSPLKIDVHVIGAQR